MKLLLAVMIMNLALATDAKAFELDPQCRQHYEAFKNPNLTYEQVGRLADKMHEADCWPVLQGLLETEPEAASLTNCQDLASQLAESNTSMLKVFDARPLRRQDCGDVPAICSPELVARRKQEVHRIKTNREKAVTNAVTEGLRRLAIERLASWDAGAQLAAIDEECNRNTTWHISSLNYKVSQHERFQLTLPECDALAVNPAGFTARYPGKLSLPRPVNCRAKTSNADGSKSGLYIWLEQYPDGDTSIWSVPIDAWAW